MCVSQFRDITYASRFSRVEDVKSSEKRTKHAPYIGKKERADGTIDYDVRVYVADEGKIKELAKLGNSYAIEYLRERSNR